MYQSTKWDYEKIMEDDDNNMHRYRLKLLIRTQ